MKKIILFVFAFIAIKSIANNGDTRLLAAPTWTKVVKENGGIFGYKYVNQDPPNPSGNQSLLCATPGWHRCRFNSTAIVVGGGTVGLTSEDFEAIDAKVMSSITETEPSGILVYNAYTVKYKYNVNSNKIKYKIFNQDEVNAGLSNAEVED